MFSARARTKLWLALGLELLLGLGLVLALGLGLGLRLGLQLGSQLELRSKVWTMDSVMIRVSVG
jgi:hypothetical protein